MDFAKFFMLNRYKKLQIHLYIKDKDLFDIEESKRIVNTFLENKPKDIFDIFNNIDLTKIVKSVDEINKYYKCPLIEGNICWISRDTKGHYRYFTRSKSKITYSLDFIDLYGILNNLYSHKLFKKLIEEFNLDSVKSVFVLKEEAKINQNIKLINEISTVDKSIEKILASSIEFYKMLCDENKCNLSNSNLKYKNNSVFFSSLSYFKEKYRLKVSKGTIGKHINLLATLGLVTKIPLSELSEDILNRSLKIQNKKYNHISFYSINQLDEKSIDEVRSVCEILIENNIKYYNINNDSLITIFGKEFSNKVFIQKFKKSRKYYAKEEEKRDYVGIVELLFKSQMVDYGFASKELIKNNILISKKEFNKIWNNLLDKYLLTEIRPNKKIKRQLNLKKYEPIVMLSSNKFNMAYCS